MALDSINSILRTGGCKTAHRGEQGGYKELICLYQEQKKAGTDSLQKISHESYLSCIRSSLVATFPSPKDLGQLSALS